MYHFTYHTAMRKISSGDMVFLFFGTIATILVTYFLLLRQVSVVYASLFCLGLLSLHLFCVLSKSPRWKLLLGSLTVTYLMLELLAYLLLCFDVVRPDVASVMGSNFGATSRPYVKYDSTSGYKYVPGTAHLVNIQQHEIVNEVQLHINKQGYCSINDFSERKIDSTKKRLVVLGDSYTAGEIVDTAWPDLVNKRFQHIGSKVELYNFGLEAAGISNWHRIFFKELVPNYDFDGIVLAVFGDINYFSSDLARDFAIKHSGAESSGLNFFETMPQNENDFREHFQPKLFFDSNIYPDSVLCHYRDKALGKTVKRKISLLPVKPYFLSYIADAIGFMQRLSGFKKRYSNRNLDHSYSQMEFKKMDEVDTYYGPQKSKLLKEILQYCVAHNKEIYLVGIPSFNLAEMDSNAYRNHNIYSRQLATIARNYQGAHFIDGASTINEIPVAQYGQYHLHNDSHWNRKMIDMFVPYFINQYQGCQLDTALKH